jgi:ABC-type multidrug transport system fused ATPase/permease subunit
MYYDEKGSLVSALWKIAAPSFKPAGLWELLFVVARISLPLSLRELLLIITKNPGLPIILEAIPFAITLSLAAITAALSQNRVTFLSTQSGICIRAALTSAIYEHSLQLTPVGRRGLTAGEVTNLVAVDSQKLFDVMVEGHNLWSCPLLIVAVSALLWITMGPELTVGVGVLILFVPVVQQIVSRMLRIRKERSKLTDVRINILTSMLQGIRVAKLNHYESKILDHVGAVRKQEMKLLRQELHMWGWVLTSAVCSPLLALAASFAFYALVSDGNIITPADAFSVLLLFAILRFPINMTARLVGKMAQALEAANRISKFLDREVRPLEEPYQRSGSGAGESEDTAAPVLDLKKGSFSIDPNDDVLATRGDSDGVSAAYFSDQESEVIPFVKKGFALRGLSLRVCKSQVVAIVGKIGSGKTLLLRALLGEVPTSSATEMTMSGSLSYAAQQPFVLNTTLRNNVIFGLDYDEEWYQKVLDACCLRPDVQRLGPAGDLTEIGERGVTLSGGQKQRVALARAVYARPDVSLLDDIFSALDANTASNVFDGLFDGEGLLRSSGTVLVTHAMHFLPRVDFILVMSDGSPSFFGTWLELQESKGTSRQLMDAIQSSSHGDGDEGKRKSVGGKLHKEGLEEKDGFIMSVEEREHGVAQLRVWFMWINNAGGWMFIACQLILLVLDRGLYVASDW